MVRLLSKDKEHRNLAEAVVVEVEGPNRKANISRCRIRQVKKGPVPLHVGFTKSGGIFKLPPSPIKYPWPGRLALRLPDDKVIDDPVKRYAPLWAGDKVKLKLLPSAPPKLRGTIENDDKSILANSMTLRVTWDIPGSIKRIAGNAITKEQEASDIIRRLEGKATNDRIEAEKVYKEQPQKLKSAKHHIEAQLSRDRAQPNKDLAKAKRSQKELVQDMLALQIVCKQLPKIVVLDPWGIPLVEFKVKFSVPGDKINIELVRLLGTPHKPKK